MNIVRKVRAVERLFKTLEKDVQILKEQTGIHCAENCIICCTTSRIVATAVEFYPLAYHLYKNDMVDPFLTRIEQINNNSICPALNQFSIEGSSLGCAFYAQRGLMCRLFAYSYRTDKYNRREISTCQIIQKGQGQTVANVNTLLQSKPLGPKATDYYQRLQFIDFNGVQRLYPIGEAIRIAIETIVSYFNYRGGKAV